jgi:alkylresorcinol/alkylpyrone synthase
MGVPTAAARLASLGDEWENGTRYSVLPFDELVRLDGLDVLASAGTLFPGTLDRSEVQLTAGGLRLMRPRGLAPLLRERLGDAVDGFLAAQGVSRHDIAFWAIHPRNPELLDAAADSLALSKTARAASRAVWRRTGNSISAALYHVVDELRASAPPVAGALGMIVAFGAGFGCELVLLRASGWLCDERVASVARRPAGEIGVSAGAA